MRVLVHCSRNQIFRIVENFSEPDDQLDFKRCDAAHAVFELTGSPRAIARVRMAYATGELRVRLIEDVIKRRELPTVGQSKKPGSHGERRHR